MRKEFQKVTCPLCSEDEYIIIIIIIKTFEAEEVAGTTLEWKNYTIH
jgi:hypothetical protein